ncbi:V-type proton ATPase 116 kDa subunit a 1-like [Halichondria panicea]|uniref:V-type proton ATPase 116 kDa subunit a 1-like n=1 Tax=Halichondria panicea TaxID=6063 RepID=UPI00312BCBE3
MSSLFRSEEMTLAQLFLQSEAAYSCVRELGELGKVQFRDVNADVNAFQRKFINEVRRCDEMERKLRFLNNELEKVGIELRPGGNVEAPEPQAMIDLESKFEVLETEVKEINTNKETLKKNLLDLIELQHILDKTRGFFQEAEQYAVTATPTRKRKGPGGEITTDEDITGREEKGLLDEHLQIATAQTKFTFVTGVIVRERVAAFERVLWRACRGNVFLRQADIMQPLEDPTTGVLENKIVFILFFQGDQLRTRVRKICDGFRATLYQCPETADERAQMVGQVAARISDLQSVLQTTEEHSITQLTEIAQDLDTWQTKVKKIKSVYHILNMFNLDVTQRCLIAECWCPVDALDEIQAALTRGTERSGSTVPSILNRMATDEAPPTYNKVNKFTRGFQAIVDAYGVATYQEVNPALYTIITFPFLFAVMFGDAGHGIIMASFAALLILFEKKLNNYNGPGGEMFVTLFNGRYIILLMGLFSIYTGMVYNDVFSKSLNIFGTSWDLTYTNGSMDQPASDILGCCPNPPCVQFAPGGHLTYVPREAMTKMTPYPFGLDPIWNVAENKLVFTNSYKMKMAITLGVMQMLFGVCLQVFNHIHFKNYLNIILEFVPQVLFLLCIFGWLVFLIFFKWCFFYVNPNYAPSLLITLINMFLKFGGSPDVTNPDPTQIQYSVFGHTDELAQLQKYIQIVLVIVALVCVPWMLLAKPIYLLIKHKMQSKDGYSRARAESGYNVTPDGEPADDERAQIILKEEGGGKHSDKMDGKEDDGTEKEGEKFEFSEIFIHQSIHTIEYCLGTISNTASYLRLWALSLAHAELSEVLWNMVFQLGIGVAASISPILGAIAVFFLFAAWAAMTIGILLVMEGLSAFLHALRLHWVEFQNKFYDGNGYKFTPFSFEAILKGEDD